MNTIEIDEPDAALWLDRINRFEHSVVRSHYAPAYGLDTKTLKKIVNELDWWLWGSEREDFMMNTTDIPPRRRFLFNVDGGYKISPADIKRVLSARNMEQVYSMWLKMSECDKKRIGQVLYIPTKLRPHVETLFKTFALMDMEVII